MNQHPAPSFAMPFSGRKNQLLNRVKRILNQPQNRSNIMEKLTATCLLLAAIFILSVGASTPFDDAREYEYEVLENHDLHFYPELIESEKNILVDVVLVSDTIPEKRKKQTYKVTREENGEKTEFTLEDGEIIELIINGEPIPESEFEKYEDMVDGIIIDIPEPPAPPAPPVAPEPFAAPAPEAPPAPPVAPKAPKPPKAPKTSFFELKTRTTQTVTSTKNEEGKTVIVIETDGGKEPMEIVIEEAGNVVLIDGNKLEEGDTAIIIDEHSPKYGYLFPDKNEFKFKTKELKFDNDALLGWVESNDAKDIWAFEDVHENGIFGFDEKEMKKMKEDQERAIKLYKEQIRAYRNDLNHQSKEMQQLTRKQMAEVNERLRELQKLQNSGSNSYLFKTDNGKAKGYLFDAQDARDNYEVFFEGKGRFYTQNVSSRIERELIRDGLISSGADYKLEINDKRMKVNGKKVSDEVFEKYKKIYERSTRSKMNKRSNMSINKKDND